MKKFKLTLSSFVIIAFMIMGVQKAAAQKACFNSKTSRQVVNNETVAFVCDMQQLQSKESANTLANKIKTYKGVKNVEVKDYNINKANFVISLPKKRGVAILQNALLAAGIATVYIDNKPVPTSQLTAVVQGMKKKK